MVVLTPSARWASPPNAKSTNLGERLAPAVGISIKGEGVVVRHDVTRFGLHRLVVAVTGKYPDIETWCEMLKGKEIKLHHYSEKVTVTVLTGYLWLFWKE